MRLLYFQHTWDGVVNSQIQNYDDKEKAHVAFHGSMRASINDTNIRKIVWLGSSSNNIVNKSMAENLLVDN